MSALIVVSLIVVLISASVTICAALRDTTWLVYIAKPLTTSLIIATALLLPDPHPYPYKVLIVVGLLYSLAGDICLMLPDDRFLYGLAMFLVAHILYIGAFFLTPEMGAELWILVMCLVAGVLMVSLLWPGIRTASLRAAVVLFMVAILSMGWQASARCRAGHG